MLRVTSMRLLMDECNQHALQLNHMFIHMCNYSDEVTNEVMK